MSSRRVQKVAEAIREVVSMSILTELQDPRVRDVTVTGVEASGDLRYAKVMVSVMGDETRQNLTLRGLQNAAGFLQSKIADRIDLRYTPRLTFVLDQGVKHSIAVAQILREVLPGDKVLIGEEALSGEQREPDSAESSPLEIAPETEGMPRVDVDSPLPSPGPHHQP
jgi:ribosome-binding factor A